VCRLPDLLRG